MNESLVPFHGISRHLIHVQPITTRARLAVSTNQLVTTLLGTLRVTTTDAATMGVSTTMRLLPDGMFAFVCVPTSMGRIEIISEPRQTQLYFGMWMHEGEWRVWGVPELEALNQAQLVQLPVTVEPEGYA